MSKVSVPSLEEVYCLHRQRIYFICYKIVKNAEDAEDLTQDVFLHLQKKLHLFKGDSAFTTWLHRVTVNLALTSLRRADARRRNQTDSLDALAAESLDTSKTLGEALLTRDKDLELVVERNTLSKLMEGMPEGYRLVVELTSQGFTQKDIACMLQCSVGNVKSQLFHGYGWLRHKMHEAYQLAAVDKALRRSQQVFVKENSNECSSLHIRMRS